MSNVIPPVQWISIAFVASIGTITNMMILWKEIKKRKSTSIKFTTKWLRLFSLISMICGTLFVIGFITIWSPIFCIFSKPLRFAFISDQFAFVGFYQLARIYYCFSQNKCHSTKGYPNWLFVIMYSVGVLLCLSGSISPWLVTKWNTQCGINNAGQYIGSNQTQATLTNISTLIYVIWDVCTLLLYLIKVYSFKKYKSQEKHVYQRIMSILTRILILTALYEFGMIACNIVGRFRDSFTNQNAAITMRILYSSSFIVSAVVGNYSMYLMQPHNDKEYAYFLRTLHKLKIHYICCCCKTAIIQAVEENMTNIVVEINDIKPKQDVSVWETQDVSVKNSHEKMPDMSVVSSIASTPVGEAKHSP